MGRTKIRFSCGDFRRHLLEFDVLRYGLYRMEILAQSEVMFSLSLSRNRAKARIFSRSFAVFLRIHTLQSAMFRALFSIFVVSHSLISFSQYFYRSSTQIS